MPLKSRVCFSVVDFLGFLLVWVFLVGHLRKSNPINTDFSQSTYILWLRLIQFLPAYGHSPSFKELRVCECFRFDQNL